MLFFVHGKHLQLRDRDKSNQLEEKEENIKESERLYRYGFIRVNNEKKDMLEK